ncbi:MAG: HIT family protein [Rhizobacter sp.]|nr:HIT family protein [Rhizobacter sp.]
MNTRPRFTPTPEGLAHCELCRQAGGLMVWADASWRVIRVEDDDFPAFYRVVAQRHRAEFTELDVQERGRCMGLVAAVEAVLRERLAPTKVNLAALGNVVPHLHWHVVARFGWDSHFPQPIWGARQRELPAPAATRLACTLDALDAAVAAALNAVG